jgi:serine/threonine protein phosphatase PrpC
MTGIRIVSCSERGARSQNEDAVRHGVARNGHYAVLADGAGGHQRGAEAAQRAVDCIERLLRDTTIAFSPESLTQIVRQAHRELLAHQPSVDPDARMHCTIVLLWIDPQAEHVMWSHVGDSRLYRIRHGRTDIVTTDDSVVQRMVQAGLITADQSQQHPQKNHLLAALGVANEIQPHTVARQVELLEGDAFLLCSDGWWEAFDDTTLAATLASALTPQDWLDDMCSRIRTLARPRQDNFTAIAIWAGDPGEVTDPAKDDTVPRALPPVDTRPSG